MIGFAKTFNAPSQYTDAYTKLIVVTHMNVGIVRRHPQKVLFACLVVYHDPLLVLLPPFLLHILFYSMLDSLKRTISGEFNLKFTFAFSWKLVC